MSDHPKSAVSLQQRLVKSSIIGSVLAGLIALVLLMAISTYQSMKVQDEIMDEISDMLLVDDISSVSNSQLDELSDEFDIQYLLKSQQNILSHSEHYDAVSENFEPVDKEYNFIWKDGKLWRTYIQTDDGLSTYIIQPLKYRFKHLLNSFAIYLGVLLVLWLIQWLFIRFMIRRQFKSFNILTRQIAEKSVDDLAPIQTQKIEFEELQPMIQQLNQLLKRLDTSLQAEQRFTSDASHELRSPLSAIQMRLQLLQRKYSDQLPLQHDLKQIQQDVNRGTLVLENLLLLARLDPENKQSLHKEQVDLSELVNEVIYALKPFIDEKSVDIDLNIDANLKLQVNKQLMFICLRNILDNAIRYLPHSGKVEIISEVAGSRVQLKIIDQGDTVTDETIQRMGERFYRALGTKTTGSGLGISICKKIIDLHDAKIEFSKNEYGGLTVVLVI